MKRWEVPIVYKGQINYIVAADTAEEAADIAADKFKGNDKADALGNEWEEIETVGAVVEIKSTKKLRERFNDHRGACAYWHNQPFTLVEGTTIRFQDGHEIAAFFDEIYEEEKPQ